MYTTDHEAITAYTRAKVLMHADMYVCTCRLAMHKHGYQSCHYSYNTWSQQCPPAVFGIGCIIGTA